MRIRMEDLFRARLFQSAEANQESITRAVYCDSAGRNGRAEARAGRSCSDGKSPTQWNEALDQMQELAPEYVALRRGEPSEWKELRRCLRTM